MENKNSQKSKNKIIVTCVSVLLAVLLVVGIVSTIMTNSGAFLRGRVAGESANFKVTNAEMKYYYRSILNSYSSYLSYMGIDTSSSLKSQQASDGVTWFDYFLKQAVSMAQQYMVTAEAAKAAGVSLDESDKAEIEAAIADMTTYATQYGYTLSQYVNLLFGSGMKISDIRSAMELSQLASKYSQQYSDSLTYTDAQITAYRDENKSTFTYADYKAFAITSTIPDGATEAEIAALDSSAQDSAKALAAAKSSEEFDSLLKAYLEKTMTTSDSTDAAGLADEITAKVEAALKTGNAYDDTTDVGKWAFDSARKAGDSTVISNEHTFTAYYMVKPSYIKDYTTKNVRHILFNLNDYDSDDAAKAKADEVLALYNAGDKTEDAFAALAKEYSGDTGSNTNGGLYENVDKGSMTDEFDAWIYDASRKTGDVEIVKSSYGYHIMYYVGEGKVSWKSTAETALKNADYSAAYEGWKTAYPVSFNYNNIGKISE